MIELSEEQQRAVKRGELVRVSLGGRDLVLLRADVFRRIQAVLEVERAVIQAGHTRGPVAAPESLAAADFRSEESPVGEVVLLPSDRSKEIRELIADDRVRSAWVGAVAAAQRSWAQEKPN